MIHLAPRLNHVLSSLSIVILSVAVAACAGGNVASKDTGETPTAKQSLDAQTMGQQIQANEAEQSSLLNAKPLRGPQDPIYVTLASTVLDKKMQEAENPKGGVALQIRKELSSDPVIQLVPGNKKASSVIDVIVAPKVSLMEMRGVHRKTGKPGKMTAVVMEATITSQSPPAIYTVY
ncbi:MAG: hypothetical protein HP490_13740, partial [Nitrospira sp.]|nr:hypothetical protein [Nitrospira sp.]